MPYEAHPLLRQPEDENAYIWRFINLPKFLELLHSSSLHFCRADQLDDPYEVMMPDEYVEAIRAGRSNLPGVAQQTRQFLYWRCTVFLNCWHLSPHESAAMWKLYAGIDAGVGLKSTYSRLKHAFDESPQKVHLGLG